MTTSPIPRLPNDIQHSIGIQADRAIFPTLSRVSRTLHSLMLDRVFEHIQLSLPKHFGEYPLVQPFDRKDTANHEPWAVTEAVKVRARRSEAMVEKCDAICDAGSKKKWGKVRSLLIETQQGGMEGIMVVLRRTAPTLRNLEIQGTPRHEFVFLNGEVDPGIERLSRHTLDFHMLFAPLPFSTLTHLIIRPGAFCRGQIYPFICHNAPNLVTLVASYNYCEVDQYDEEHMLFPPSTGLNNLRQIQASWGDDERGRVNYDYGEDHYRTLASLLHVSPKLERLAVCGVSIGGNLTDASDFVEAIIRHRGLQDVAWNSTSVALRRRRPAASVGSLRRLVLRLDEWSETVRLFARCEALSEIFLTTQYESLSHIENLTSLYYDYSTSPGLVPIIGLVCSSDTSHPQAMLPSFSRHLRINTNLRFLHHLREKGNAWNLEVFDVIDQVDRSESHTGVVKSIRCNNEELLSARILTDIVQVSDRERFSYPDDIIPLADEYNRAFFGPHPYLDGMHHRLDKHYSVAGGSERTRTCERRSNLTWVQFTDYQGRVVPLKIISEMQRVEGGAVDWDRRGVEVGHAAWRVLLDWFEADAGTGTV